jgi:hypothetical protein
MRWTLKDGLLNGRGEERDRSDIWDSLGHAVGNVWPRLRWWIMHHIPSEDDTDWFTRANRIMDNDDEGCIEDLDIAAKHSSLGKVGFFSACLSFNLFLVAHLVLASVSPEAYDAACQIIRTLASSGSDFECLVRSGVNPFFMIYAFADCGVPLPCCFSRELLWKHLDGIIEERCWRGLGSNHADAQSSSSPSVNLGPPYVCGRKDDPESIIELLTLDHRDLSLAAKPDSEPIHKLHIAVSDCYWLSTGEMGTVWYEAQDLDDGDIPPFAVMDALTRILPHCRGKILEVHTNSVRLLWGIGGAPSGAWCVVRSICDSHQVHLRAKWDQLRGWGNRLHAHPARGSAPVPGRDADLVSAVVEQLRMLDGSTSYRGMVGHLLK